MSRRRAQAAALAAWSALFAWLWLSGTAGDHVGTRTSWVVPFGATALGLAALGLAAPAVRREAASPRATARDALGLVVLLLPVLAVLAAPSATLGGFAVARKGDARAVAALPLPVQHGPEAPPNLFDVAVGGQRPDVAGELGLADGRAVTLTGLVSATRGTELDLSRLLTNCCAADALAYTVRVRAPGELDPGDPLPLDTWLTVSGTLRQDAGGFWVDAERVEEVDAPDDPYAAV